MPISVPYPIHLYTKGPLRSSVTLVLRITGAASYGKVIKENMLSYPVSCTLRFSGVGEAAFVNCTFLLRLNTRFNALHYSGTGKEQSSSLTTVRVANSTTALPPEPCVSKINSTSCRANVQLIYAARCPKYTYSHDGNRATATGAATSGVGVPAVRVLLDKFRHRRQRQNTRDNVLGQERARRRTALSHGTSERLFMDDNSMGITEKGLLPPLR